MRLFGFLAVLPISLTPIADRPFTPERIFVPSAMREATGYDTHSAEYFRSLLQERPGSEKARDRDRDGPRSQTEPSTKPNPDREGTGESPNTGVDDDLSPTPISTTPEPATVILLGTGVAALFIGQRLIRRKRAG